MQALTVASFNPTAQAAGQPWLPRTIRRIAYGAALALLAALLVTAVGSWRGAGWLAGAPPDLPAPFPAPETSWRDHIAALDATIARNRNRAALEATDWLSPSAEAAAWLDRASMTGRWQDYARAEAAIAVAFGRSIEATAPHPLAANLALALHRNGRIEPELAAASADRTFAEPAAQSGALTLRGDVALYRGDWRLADARNLAAQRLADDPTIRFRRAFILERTGPADSAIRAYAEAARTAYRPSRRLLSAVATRIGNIELARGQWDRAADWYAKADHFLPGDWHVTALQLQMRALDGDLTGAIAGMARLAGMHDRPELWDALSAWQRALGNRSAADAAAARATAGWNDWMAHYPEAAIGHAAEHALIAGDRNAAVLLARRNYANRPFGDAAILLVTALSAAGETAEARALLARTTASGWRTTESDRLAFELAALAGDTTTAEAARTAALARNPRAFDPAARLILFGLH